jgi:hypothetical protein
VIAALPYLLAASAGAYVAGIGAMIAGKWPSPARVSWWLVILALVAFTLDRLYPDIAYVAAPVIFITIAAIVIRVATAPHILRARDLLWAIFLCVPLIVIAVAAIGDFFPQQDTNVMTFWAGSLLVLPGLGALAAGALRLTSRLRRT